MLDLVALAWQYLWFLGSERISVGNRGGDERYLFAGRKLPLDPHLIPVYTPTIT